MEKFPVYHYKVLLKNAVSREFASSAFEVKGGHLSLYHHLLPGVTLFTAAPGVWESIELPNGDEVIKDLMRDSLE